MTTQKELIAQHRKGLDETFLEKYPNGRFVLQYRNDNLALLYGPPYWSIHWCVKRSTSHTHYRGISTEMDSKGIHHKDYQNNSWGRCRNFNSYEKLVAACKKYECPVELLRAFSHRYENRKNEGFEV